jgi:hypothetical protein
MSIVSRSIDTSGSDPRQSSRKSRSSTSRSRSLSVSRTATTKFSRQSSALDTSLVDPAVFHACTILHNRLTSIETLLSSYGQFRDTQSALGGATLQSSLTDLTELEHQLRSLLVGFPGCLQNILPADDFSTACGNAAQLVLSYEEKLKGDLNFVIENARTTAEAIDYVERLKVQFWASLQTRSGLTTCLHRRSSIAPCSNQLCSKAACWS